MTDVIAKFTNARADLCDALEFDGTELRCKWAAYFSVYDTVTAIDRFIDYLLAPAIRPADLITHTKESRNEPMAAFRARMRTVQRTLRAAGESLRELVGADRKTKTLNREWAGRYEYSRVTQPILNIIRTIEIALPVQLTTTTRMGYISAPQREVIRMVMVGTDLEPKTQPEETEEPTDSLAEELAEKAKENQRAAGGDKKGKKAKTAISGQESLPPAVGEAIEAKKDAAKEANPTPPPDTLSTRETALRFGIHPNTLGWWEQRGRLVPVRADGFVRYLIADVENLEKQGKDLLKANETIARLGCSMGMLWYWERRKVLVPIRTDGVGVRYRVDDVERFEKTRKPSSQSDRTGLDPSNTPEDDDCQHLTEDTQ